MADEHSLIADGESAAVSAASRADADDRMTDEQMRANVVRLAFGGSEERLAEFLQVIREDIPPGTAVVLRGSAITGRRWKDGAPFDVDGPGTSDLDLTLVGDQVIGLFTITGFFIPGVHSRPLSDEDPNIAPDLVPLRETLMAMTGRPVNIQATRKAAMKFRSDTLGQASLLLIDETPAAESPRGASSDPPEDV